jgi:hypothetical protein
MRRTAVTNGHVGFHCNGDLERISHPCALAQSAQSTEKPCRSDLTGFLFVRAVVSDGRLTFAAIPGICGDVTAIALLRA